MHAPHAGGCQRWLGPPNGVHARISHCPAWHLWAHPHIPRMSQPAIFGTVVCLLLARLGAVCIVLYTPWGAHTCPKHPILPPLIFSSHTSQDNLLRSGPPCMQCGWAEDRLHLLWYHPCPYTPTSVPTTTTTATRSRRPPHTVGVGRSRHPPRPHPRQAPTSLPPAAGTHPHHHPHPRPGAAAAEAGSSGSSAGDAAELAARKAEAQRLQEEEEDAAPAARAEKLAQMQQRLAAWQAQQEAEQQ